MWWGCKFLSTWSDIVRREGVGVLTSCGCRRCKQLCQAISIRVLHMLCQRPPHLVRSGMHGISGHWPYGDATLLLWSEDALLWSVA